MRTTITTWLSASVIAFGYYITLNMLFVPTVRPVAASVIVEKSQLTRGKELVEFIAPGECHMYTIDVDSGGYASIQFNQTGCDLVVILISPDGDTVAVVDGPALGPEMVTFESDEDGRYRIAVHLFDEWTDFGTVGGDYVLTVEQLLTSLENDARVIVDSLRIDSVSSFIREHAIPLTTCEYNSGFEDLEPLKRLIGDARIVALGEATHGTREFFQVKLRMLEFLVEEMGFTGFVIEASMPECFDIDRYVLTGKGDPEQALAGQYFWTWNTQEVLALIEWMRSYNADPSHTRKIRFYGNDMQYGTRAARVTLDYLAQVDPTMASQVGDSLAVCLNPFNNGYLDDRLTYQKRNQMLDFGERLLKYIQLHETAYVRTSSQVDYDFAFRHANVLLQYLRLNCVDASNPYYSVRDSSMAENTLWALENEGLDGRLLFWAHNYHIVIDSLVQGWYLRRALGDRYYTIGMVFNQGSFQAMEYDDNGSQGLRWFSVPPMERGTSGKVFADAGHQICVLELRNLDSLHLVRRWFDEPRRSYQLGSGFNDTSNVHISMQAVLGKSFDALLFVDSTSAAHANPSVSVGKAPVLQPILSNADFEVYTADSLPQCWSGGRDVVFGYLSSVTQDNPYNGKRCLLMQREHGEHYGETHSRMVQRFRARMWREQTVTVKVAARIEPLDQSTHAYLTLGGDVEQVSSTYCDGLDSMICVEVVTGDWRVYEVTGKVKDDANTIEVGLNFVGEGKAWFDAVAIRGSR